MSLILFGDGKGYVMTSVPIKSHEERKFTQQFEKIFRAAISGDLTECLLVVEEGYTDFEAVSFGKFRTKSGKKLDNVTPLRAAELYGHQIIVRLFGLIVRSHATSAARTERTIAEMLAIEAAKKYRSELDQSWDRKQNLKSEYYTRLDDDDRVLYEKQTRLLKLMKPSDISYWVHHALESSYTAEELQEKKQLIDGLTERNDQIKFFKIRIEQPFNVNYADAKRVMMMAFVDFAEKKLD